MSAAQNRFKQAPTPLARSAIDAVTSLGAL